MNQWIILLIRLGEVYYVLHTFAHPFSLDSSFDSKLFDLHLLRRQLLLHRITDQILYKKALCIRFSRLLCDGMQMRASRQLVECEGISLPLRLVVVVTGLQLMSLSHSSSSRSADAEQRQRQRSFSASIYTNNRPCCFFFSVSIHIDSMKMTPTARFETLIYSHY